MSCEFCEDGRSLFGGAEDMGCMVEEIGIEGICYLSADKTKPPVDETERGAGGFGSTGSM